MTPTQAVLKGSSVSSSVTDKAGRRLLLRRPTALDTLRLFKAAGPLLAQNEAWLAMASLACSVQEIDGVPIPAPANEGQIESLVDRLGDDGLLAVSGWMNARPVEVVNEAHVGNSLGTPS